MERCQNIEGRPASLPDAIAAAAKERFGIDYLFPFQRLVISNILRAAGVEGFAPAPFINPVTGEEDSIDAPPHQIVIIPTGAGKSLCFMLPAALLPGPTLVVFPLLSLMADQARRVREAGMEPVVLRGGQDGDERNRLWKKIESGTAKMVLTNPEIALQRENRKRISAAGFSHLVIDEMHTVSEWGESFRPVFLEIDKLTAAAKIPIITAFTATASETIIEKVKRIVFPGLSPNIVTANPDRPNIGYTVIPSICKEHDLVQLLLPGSAAEPANSGATVLVRRPALVFCRSRVGAEMTARFLRHRLGEEEIYFYHAGLTEPGRKKEDRRLVFHFRRRYTLRHLRVWDTIGILYVLIYVVQCWISGFNQSH